jgi:hypothetical protein
MSEIFIYSKKQNALIIPFNLRNKWNFFYRVFEIGYIIHNLLFFITV